MFGNCPLELAAQQRQRECLGPFDRFTFINYTLTVLLFISTISVCGRAIDRLEISSVPVGVESIKA